MTSSDFSDYTDCDDSIDMESCDTDNDSSEDFNTSDDISTDSFETSNEIDSLDFSDGDVPEMVEDGSIKDSVDSLEPTDEEIDTSDFEPDFESDNSDYDINADDIEALNLESDDSHDESDLPLDEDMTDESLDVSAEEPFDINTELPGSYPDPLDYEEETDNGDMTGESLDVSAEEPFDINTELPGSYSDPLDYEEETDDEEDGFQGEETPDTEIDFLAEGAVNDLTEDIPEADSSIIPEEIRSEISENTPEPELDISESESQSLHDLPDMDTDREYPETDISDFSSEWPEQFEFEEEADNPDRPKVLVRELTPEMLESRQRDMEEVLDNYRESLRNRGVSENSIEAFVQDERIKMEREYESLDRGDEDPYVYHYPINPSDWDAVASSLIDAEHAETIDDAGATDTTDAQMVPDNDLLSEASLPEQEWTETNELAAEETDDVSLDHPEDDVEENPENILDDHPEETEEMTDIEEEQEPIDVDDIDYDAVFQDISPEELEEGYQDIELDDDPELYTSVLESFEDDTWENLDLDERKEAMEAMADFIGDKIQLENPPKIEYYYNEQEGDYGGYRPGDNVLEVNEYMLYEADEAADTIAHELWHAHQHECAENPQTERDYLYRYNFQNYIRHSISPERYRSQLVEAEAYAFADQIKAKLLELNSMKG